MAFRARTVAGSVSDPKGRGPALSIDGVAFTGHSKIYPGTPKEFTLATGEKVTIGSPSDAQLAHPQLIVETIAGEIWPGCSADTTPQRNANAQFVRATKGEWPDEREVVLQKNTEARLKDPVGFATALAIRRGMKPSEIQKHLRAAFGPKGIEDLSTLMEEVDISAVQVEGLKDEQSFETADETSPAPPSPRRRR